MWQCVCLLYLLVSALCLVFFFLLYADHRDLHLLTHSFPTRRSSDLSRARGRRSTGLMTTSRRSSRRARARRSSTSTRSEEHTSELQSLMSISYAVFCLKKKKNVNKTHTITNKLGIKNNTTLNKNHKDVNIIITNQIEHYYHMM